MKKLIFLSFLFLSAGCAVAPFASPIVTGAIMWKDGEARKYYHEEAAAMRRAAKLSLKELDFAVTQDGTDKDGGFYIVAGDKDKFKITIRQVKPHITEVKIRVNFMGDKPYAELVYRQIDLNTNTIDYDDQGVPTKNKRTK